MVCTLCVLNDSYSCIQVCTDRLPAKGNKFGAHGKTSEYSVLQGRNFGLSPKPPCILKPLPFAYILACANMQ